MINAKGTRVRKIPSTQQPSPAPQPLAGGNSSTDNMTSSTFIRAEVNRQLRELKVQLNKEIVEDLRDMQADLMKTITPIITSTVEQQVRAALATMHVEVDKKVAKATSEVTEANNKQLAVSHQSTRELVRAASTEICDDVYRQVINEINEKVVPKVDNMMQWVNYKTRDEDETVDSYRRAVERQANPELRMLTDGKHDGRIISPYVRTFFGDD